MKLILEFDEFINRESPTRTKKITEDEFLKLLSDNCKNFSFQNDLLFRKTNNVGEFGFYSQKERRRTIGEYNYKTFFDDRKDYPVPRYKSLIGSTTLDGAEFFGSDYKNYMVIPFDGANIVFACVPDLALLSKLGHSDWNDDMFIMKTYESGFKVPNEELFQIMDKTPASKFKNTIIEKRLGFEFFTNSNALLIEVEKIEWLKSNI